MEVALVPLEQLANPEGKEGRDTKVQQLFFGLVLENQNVAWLNQGS